MTFLNAALLSGLALVGIPILIHLLHRRRVKVVRWGAMHLLEATIKKHSRRFRWEQLILLLIRCAIPVLLALALARPVLTSMKGLLGGANSSTVVLLDNSYSMEAGGRPSNFELARQFVAAKLKALRGGSDVAIHLMAGGRLNAASPTTDPGKLAEALNQLDSGFGKASMPDALASAAELLGAMKNPFREVIIVSDFQRINWSPGEAAGRMRALEVLRKMPIPPQITFVRPGHETRDNVSVDALEFSRLIAGVGQPLPIRANLRNHGERAWPDLRVYFRVDGRERSVQQITLQPTEQRQLLFTHTFDNGGSHVVEVFADADALKADNSSLAAIPVWDRVPVLLINGDPNNTPLRGETDFLEIALKPYGLAKIPFADLIEPRVTDTGGLTSDALNSVRVCVLANVRQLSDRQVQSLRDFVREGGGLLIFPGNKADPDWYNRVLHGGGLLPAPVTSVTGSTGNATPAAKIVAEHFAHPALELFNDPRNGTLADTEVRFWFRFGEPSNPNDATPPLARLDSGDPFFIERKFGEGRVIACATACDADWSNLPARPVYVPLMQRLITYLASTVFPPRNISVGKPLLAFYSRNDARKKAFVTDPAGKRTDLTVEMVGTHGVAEYRGTAHPGLYTLVGPDGAPMHFVVSTSREESDLAWLSDDELQIVAKEFGAGVATSWEEYALLDQQRRYGREAWRPLLWAVLGLVFTELVLEQWFARRVK